MGTVKKGVVVGRLGWGGGVGYCTNIESRPLLAVSYGD